LKPHPVEIEMGLTAREILDVIRRSDRCYQAVRGYVAERHLEILVERLKDGGTIQGFERINQDGKPDLRVARGGRWQTVECKNVKTGDAYKNGDRKVDFQRTRNQKGAGATTGRFYKPDEFDVLAAASHTAAGVWTFKFIRVGNLPVVQVEGVTCCIKVVRVPKDMVGSMWSSDLVAVLDAGASA
jgi:hypothetical protein